MKLHSLNAAVLVLIVVALAACGSSTASAPPSAAPSAVPATFDSFSTDFCGAFTSMARAIGNPDANTPSVLSKALDDAVAAGDGAAADRAAAAVMAELESARAQTASAARWQPTAGIMAHMDRLLLAYEASTTAKRALAHAPGSADPAKVFEQAGAREAWAGLVGGVGSMPVPSGTPPMSCKAFSGQG